MAEKPNVTEDQIRTVLSALMGAHQDLINSWFDHRIPAFNMDTPREMIARGDGADVMKALTDLLPTGQPNQIRNSAIPKDGPKVAHKIPPTDHGVPQNDAKEDNPGKKR